MTIYESGPIIMHTAPAPPVGLADPFLYTATSTVTTHPSFLPSYADDSTQATVLNNAAVPP